jgi:hypothetical protein
LEAAAGALDRAGVVGGIEQARDQGRRWRELVVALEQQGAQVMAACGFVGDEQVLGVGVEFVGQVLQVVFDVGVGGAGGLVDFRCGGLQRPVDELRQQHGCSPRAASASSLFSVRP